jgi:hypothetical protein
MIAPVEGRRAVQTHVATRLDADETAFATGTQHRKRVANADADAGTNVAETAR